MVETTPIPFDFTGHEVRILIQNGEPWFVAKDVAEVLGYSNHRDAIAKHCKTAMRDGVAIRDALGREQSMVIIPERDVYRLIFRSRLPAAEQFEDWVVEEVLPALRKHGQYVINPPSTEKQPHATLNQADVQFLSNYMDSTWVISSYTIATALQVEHSSVKQWCQNPNPTYDATYFFHGNESVVC